MLTSQKYSHVMNLKGHSTTMPHWSSDSWPMAECSLVVYIFDTFNITFYYPRTSTTTTNESQIKTKQAI